MSRKRRKKVKRSQYHILFIQFTLLLWNDRDKKRMIKVNNEGYRKKNY